MIQAIQSAETLSYSSQYQRRASGLFETSCTYQVWLKKPNLCRMESRSASREQGGIIVGDGRDLWIHWPNGRPKWEYVKETAEDEKTRLTSFMRKPIPPEGI